MKRKDLRNDEVPLKASRFGLGEEHPIQVMNQKQSLTDSELRFDMHYELEIGIVLEGSMERVTGDSRQLCKAGEMWFCGMWEPHGYRSETSCHRVVIAIWPPALINLHFPEVKGINWMLPFNISSDRRPTIPEFLRDELKEIVNRHVLQGKRLSPARKRLFVIELLLWLFENELVDTTINDTTFESDRKVRITPAIELAFARKDLVTNDEAARTCGLSRDIFIRSFRGLMGVSFSAFAVRQRLSRAADQLLKTDMPVKAIADEWGFTDTSHLHRLFKKHLGCTPMEYRETTGKS